MGEMAMQATPEITALRDIADRARSQLGADRCTVYQLDRERGEIFSRVAHGLPEGEEIRLPLSRGVIGSVARTGRTLRLRDAYNDPRFDPATDQRTGYRTKSILCMPVVNEQRDVLGAIQLINKVSGTFSEADETALEPLCREVASLLSSAT
jgi:adenylate cyclase